MENLHFFTDITINNTRFREKPNRLPVSEPYTSVFTDTIQQMQSLKDPEIKESEAVFYEKLNAGKTLPPNGGLGLYFSPHRAPEMLNGNIWSSSI